MAGRRLSMRKIKEVLRLKFQYGHSNKQIAQSCNIARSTVREYLNRAGKAGVTWPLDPSLDDASLEKTLFPPQPLLPSSPRTMPPMEYLHQELRRKGVTLQLLWHEYKQANPEGYQYSQFCELYRQWAKKLDVTLRQEHRAGEKLFVDYAGQTIPIVDPATGEDHPGSDLYRHPGSQQLHLRRSLRLPGSALLDPIPCPCLRVLRRRPRNPGPG